MQKLWWQKVYKKRSYFILLYNYIYNTKSELTNIDNVNNELLEERKITIINHVKKQKNNNKINILNNTFKGVI